MLPCQMTLVDRKPGTFLLLRGIGKTSCVRQTRWPLHSIAGHSTKGERGAWLNALPVSSLGTLLDSESFRAAIALRVGADVCIPHSCRCCGRMDSRGLHGLSCRYSAGRFPRHSVMNDVVKRALQKAGLPSVLEPPGLDRVDGLRSSRSQSSRLVVVGVWFGITRGLIPFLGYT